LGVPGEHSQHVAVETHVFVPQADAQYAFKAAIAAEQSVQAAQAYVLPVLVW
jgi:hypothetical protein